MALAIGNHLCGHARASAGGLGGELLLDLFARDGQPDLAGIGVAHLVERHEVLFLAEGRPKLHADMADGALRGSIPT